MNITGYVALCTGRLRTPMCFCMSTKNALCILKILGATAQNIRCHCTKFIRPAFVHVSIKSFYDDQVKKIIYI